MRTNSIVLFSALIVLLSPAANARPCGGRGRHEANPVVNTTEGAYVAGHGLVNQINEKDTEIRARIDEGLKSGQLSQAQADEFKKRLVAIQTKKTSDMSVSRGHLNHSEFDFLHGELKKVGREVNEAVTKH